jgi:V/A-type H+-transporting ATPase subunit C
MRMGKDKTFLHRALAQCRTLNKEILSEAAGHGEEAFFSYLQRTPYAGAVSSIRESTASFERYCDDLMIEKIRPQRHISSGIDPIAAYILARKNEIKTVRMILTGKRNEMPEEEILSRVRTTYV